MKNITANQLKEMIYKGVNSYKNDFDWTEVTLKNLHVTGFFRGLSFDKFKRNRHLRVLTFINCTFYENLLIKQSSQGNRLDFITIQNCAFKKSLIVKGANICLKINDCNIVKDLEAVGLRAIVTEDIRAKHVILTRGYKQSEEIDLDFGKFTIETLTANGLLKEKGIEIGSCHIGMLPIVGRLFPNNPIRHIYGEKNMSLVTY
jgi:hypothetical protein